MQETTVVASLTHVRVVVDHTYTANPTAEIKISHWFHWSVSLAYQVFMFCLKAS